ncbi:unnamed protein product, partial [Symbiodinium pilosum]
AFTRLQLNDPEVYGEELEDEVVLRVLAATEPALRGLVEVESQEFLDLCPPAGPEFAAAVPASWAESLLEQQPPLRSLRLRLVPAKIAEEAFWARYFGAVFQILEDQLADELRNGAAVSERGKSNWRASLMKFLVQ